MFNPRAYANTRPDGMPVLELVADTAERAAAVEVAPPAPVPAPVRPPARQFVPLKRTTLGGEVIGPLASLRLTQVFGFLPEQVGNMAQVVEALYRFPLPGDAAVTGVRVRFGDVEIAAQL